MYRSSPTLRLARLLLVALLATAIPVAFVNTPDARAEEKISTEFEPEGTYSHQEVLDKCNELGGILIAHDSEFEKPGFEGALMCVGIFGQTLFECIRYGDDPYKPLWCQMSIPAEVIVSVEAPDSLGAVEPARPGLQMQLVLP